MIALDFSQWAALWYVGGMISGAPGYLCQMQQKDRLQAV